MTTLTLLGYDRDGHEVWQHPDGRVAYGKNKAFATEMLRHDLIGVTLAEHVDAFGPITKEKK